MDYSACSASEGSNSKKQVAPEEKSPATTGTLEESLGERWLWRSGLGRSLLGGFPAAAHGEHPRFQATSSRDRELAGEACGRAEPGWLRGLRQRCRRSRRLCAGPHGETGLSERLLSLPEMWEPPLEGCQQGTENHVTSRNRFASHSSLVPRELFTHRRHAPHNPAPSLQTFCLLQLPYGAGWLQGAQAPPETPTTGGRGQ